jgi:uncharacterized protein YjiS (DUF1127 family)
MRNDKGATNVASSTIATRALPLESQDPAAPRLAAPVKAIKRLIVWTRNERRLRRGVNELMALDDRMLADIGLTRGDIGHAARHGRTWGRTMAFADSSVTSPSTMLRRESCARS